MITPGITLQEPLISEVTLVLIDLAKLVQRAGTTSGNAVSDLAHEMLGRLLTACHAQQGAVLLVVLGDPLAEQPVQVKDPRILTLNQMREEEVYTLLDAIEPVMKDNEQTAYLSCWVTFRQSLVDGQDGQSLRALLVFGWTGLDEDTCASAVARGQKMLPFLEDAVASVIVTILQAERLYEFEQNAMRESLERMDMFKAELLGTVSHELRSPLASIKGYAATLLRHERRLRREERHQFLLAINEGTDHLERIVGSLLEMSQFETEAIALDVSPVDVARLSREAMRAAGERLSAKFGGRFSFGLLLEDSDGKPAESVPLLEADPRRLREVLDNLLENAIKYSPEGGTITVAVRPVTVDWPINPREDVSARRQRRSMLEVCVCDTGIGIQPEHLERIFDRFYRVDMRLTREMNGLGLGLTICKRIIELHDGAIWAESLPEGGSTFRVLLPLAASREG